MVESTRTTAAPVARRTRSAGWRDPRIIGGLVLMAICVLAGGWALDSRADDATVLVLNRDLAAGATIGRADVDVRKVHLAGDVAARYFGSVGDLPGDARLAHAVGSGNLLPRSALDRDEDAARVEVPLAVAPEDLPTTVRAGSVVDVWVLPDRDRGNDEKTVRVLAGVPVLKLDDASDALSPQDSRQVIVTLPAGDDRLSHALATMAGGRVLLTRRD